MMEYSPNDPWGTDPRRADAVDKVSKDIGDRESVYESLIDGVALDLEGPMKLGFTDLGPDAPMEVNAKGAKQSKTGYRSDLIPAKALLAVSAVCAAGAEKYGEWNWVGLDIEDNLGHCITHILAWLSGDRQDSHLSHAACRILFALEQEARGHKAKDGYS